MSNPETKIWNDPPLGIPYFWLRVFISLVLYGTLFFVWLQSAPPTEQELEPYMKIMRQQSVFSSDGPAYKEPISKDK